jgi:adenosylcobinamide kinase/adenosylcobinamide-phosphate guanylyltransferase
MEPTHELILGGARSGKSRRAEDLASLWLAAGPGRSATLLATALAADDEMAARIRRHRGDRAVFAPGLDTLEVPIALPAALREQDDPQRLLLVDCLTLWLTQCLLPPPGLPVQDWPALERSLLEAVRQARSPLVFVSNEIGLGVMPMSVEARQCVDALGRLHQRLAPLCHRVTLMVAGLPLAVKGGAA